MHITLRVDKVKRTLLRVWMFLVLAGLGVECWKYVAHLPKNDWTYFFGLSYEQNLPTWYVSLLLGTCAITLAGIAASTWRSGGRHVWNWWLLCAAFFYISMDETATIHEHASGWLDLDGFFFYSWVVPAGTIVAVLGLLFIKFLVDLPSKTRWRFIQAGSIYVGGALGVELLLGYWTDAMGVHNLVYGLIDLLEEGMEIMGVTLFLCALLEYVGTARLRFLEEPVETPVESSAGASDEQGAESPHATLPYVGAPSGDLATEDAVLTAQLSE